MPGYVFANIRIKDSAAYEQYKELVPGTIERYGGRYLARGSRAEVIEGKFEPGRMIIVEFPSYEDAKAWYSSAEYGAAKLLRQGAAEGELVVVEGV